LGTGGGLISPLSLWNSNTGYLSGAGMVFAAGSDGISSNSFIGGVGSRRSGDGVNSRTAVRVLSNNVLSAAADTDAVWYVEGSNSGAKVFNRVPMYIQEVIERINYDATQGLGTNLTLDVLTNHVLLLGANSAANSTVNIRGNSTVRMNDILSSNQAFTCVIMVPNGATPRVIQNVQIDGVTQTLTGFGGSGIRWQGNTVPTVNFAGTAAATDSYTFTIVKTNPNTFITFASVTRFG
jgi:hypothetical protein